MSFEKERYNKEFILSMLKELPSNIYFKDTEGKYVFCNHYWRHLKTDGTPDWSIEGKTDLDIRIDTENAIKAMEEDKQILESGVGTKYTIKIDQDGITEYLEIIKNPVVIDGEIIGIVGLINDITDRVLLEKELEASALVDPLTGLFNRRFLYQFVKEQNNEDNYPLIIISADCNGLKRINDVYGHKAGDEYIVKTSELLRTTLPKNSYIVRMGGDEFLAVIPKQSEEMVEKLKSVLNSNETKIQVMGEKLSVAFGIYCISKYTSNLFSCFNEVDEMMYQDKEEKKRKLY